MRHAGASRSNPETDRSRRGPVVSVLRASSKGTAFGPSQPRRLLPRPLHRSRPSSLPTPSCSNRLASSQPSRPDSTWCPWKGKCLEGPPSSSTSPACNKPSSPDLTSGKVDVVHLQHLTLGGTPALLQALPDHPRIALAHGTDLLFAQIYRDQPRFCAIPRSARTRS
jgi:hypothetical protein